MYGWASFWVAGLLQGLPLALPADVTVELEPPMQMRVTHVAPSPEVLSSHQWANAPTGLPSTEGIFDEIELLDRIYRAQSWFGVKLTPEFAMLVDVRFDATPELTANDPSRAGRPDIAACLGIGINADLQLPAIR